MNTIQSRNDVSLLVNSFYAKIRRDELLGPIFNGHISEEKWPEHLEKLTDFWETNLFRVIKFKGNPSVKHVKVDSNLNHSIEKFHFDNWLGLWFETVDEMYEGDLAIRAKESAQKMAMGQYITILNNRSAD
jgi:hemoglobin